MNRTKRKIFNKIKGRAVNRIKLIQYQIHKDLEQKTFRDIGRKILKNDPIWHFFHDGQYSLIRMQENAYRQITLEAYLKRKKIGFDKRPYEDPHELVRKYQDLFIPAFHAFTVLGLERGEGELGSLLERVSHCFLNMANCYDETGELGRLFIFRMQINFQHDARRICTDAIYNVEKMRLEKPDEFRKMFAPVPAPGRGR